MSLQTINSLIKKVLDGDSEAFAEIIEFYQHDVGIVIAGMLFSSAERDDLIQQTFIDAFTHLERFDTSRDFGQWLKGIARNLSLQHMRSAKRRFRHLQEYRKQKEVLEKEPKRTADSDAQYIALEKCLDNLPEHTKQILTLKYTSSLNIKAIAVKIGKSDAAIQKTLSRTRLSLKDCVERRILAT